MSGDGEVIGLLGDGVKCRREGKRTERGGEQINREDWSLQNVELDLPMHAMLVPLDT